MLASELRGKDKEALHSELVGLQKELFNIRFQRVSEQLKNTLRIRVIRHDIARIKTVASEMSRNPDPKSAKPVKRKK